MSCLVWIYIVFPLVFEFLVWYSLDETFLKFFADVNFVICIICTLRVKATVWFLGLCDNDRGCNFGFNLNKPLSGKMRDV